MIQDVDGPDPAPDRRGHVIAVSVLLLLGVVAGYAAVSSPELRGPYATPRPLPSVVHAVFTPAPALSIEPAALVRPFAPCAPASVWVTTIVVNRQPVSVVVAGASSDPCVIRWGLAPIPYDSIAR